MGPPQADPTAISAGSAAPHWRSKKKKSEKRAQRSSGSSWTQQRGCCSLLYVCTLWCGVYSLWLEMEKTKNTDTADVLPGKMCVSAVCFITFQELKLKDKECERLSQVRNQLEQELEELTASLFEEAHKMVRDANVKQAGAEKQLREAQGKVCQLIVFCPVNSSMNSQLMNTGVWIPVSPQIDVLQAEVTALKTLVLTSTPSSPNRQLHPQLQAAGGRGSYKRGGGHVRTSSAGGAFQTSSGKPEPSTVSIEPVAKEEREMDSVLFAEFLSWNQHPSLDRSSAFLSRVYREDIGPCLSFTRSELSQLVHRAVENNSLTIEPVAVSALPMVKASALECGGPKASVETKCALSGLSRVCRHRIKLGDKGSYYYISPSSRARITAVCNFFTYIRYIQQGLVRQKEEQMFWEVMRLRREMTVAKLGFYLTDQG
uniref:RAB3A interacting protein like 1 n=1 Tax=Fundulus heteroclitus TaxID=8078 RepID=A0A3Q2NWJ0_FUNHE